LPRRRRQRLVHKKMIPSKTGEVPPPESVSPVPAAPLDEAQPIDDLLRSSVRAGSVSGIEEILAVNGWKSLFVVTQEDAWSLTGAGRSLDPILSRIRTSRFSGFSPNPKLEDVREGIAAFRESGADAILAVGGGSAIDMAKLVSALSPQKDPPLDILRGEKSLTRAAVPVIAVPTTAGTGSEATHFAVVYVDGRKLSLAHPGMLPRYPVVDPDLTANMP